MHQIYAEILHSLEVFKLNYAQMEREFKVFVYPDGDPNSFYQTPRNLTGKYASEGILLFSMQLGISTIVEKYVEKLISKYPYWNRTQGVDYLFVTCHDIGVKAT
ncbi:hypothetical protein Patl1_37081 [Pistacia atlantica]|nr:hypothetical protein Patl1_37081 [Pistacia atlantica]